MKEVTPTSRPLYFREVRALKVAPMPFPTVRGQNRCFRRALKCGSMVASRSPVGWGDRSPGQATGEGKLSRHCAGREDKERTGLACSRAKISVSSVFGEPTLMIAVIKPTNQAVLRNWSAVCKANA